MAREEPLTPLFRVSEGAGGEVTRKVFGHLLPGLTRPFRDGGLYFGRQCGKTGAQPPRILCRDRERPAAAFVATGVAREPIARAFPRFGEGRIDRRQHANFHALLVWRDHLSSVLEIFSIFSIFALFYGVAVYGWVRAGLRERCRAQILDAALPALLGQNVHQARALMGEPSKIEFGMSGRRLYIWRPPTALALPETPELTVVTLTVEANDIVSRTSWKAD